MRRSFLCGLLLFSFFCSLRGYAQTEFPKEFILHLRLGSGTQTKFHAGQDLFALSAEVVPQFTLVTGKLRGGGIAGLYYAGHIMSGLFGPTVSWKIAEFKGGYFGSIGNAHLSFNHLWGTDYQRFVGGGVNLDLLNKLMVGVAAHRDYRRALWWVQSSIAFRLSKVKKPKETFPN